MKLNVLHLDKIKLFFKILITITSLNLIQANNEITSANKSPKKAFYFSLIPGLGQVYNDKLIKSALVVGLELSAYNAWRSNLEKYNTYDENNFPLKKHRYLEKRNKYAWWIGILYFYAMIDAVVDAHLNSFDSLMDSPLKQKNSKRKTNEK